MGSSYCVWGDCEEPTRQGRRLCEMHEKRRQRGADMSAPKQERLTPAERLLELAIRLADADSDEEFRRARRGLLSAARALGPKLSGEIIRDAMAAARRRGVRIGRPPKLTADQARAALEEHGSVIAAARALGVHRRTLQRTLRRATEGHLPPHDTVCPQARP